MVGSALLPNDSPTTAFWVSYPSSSFASKSRCLHTSRASRSHMSTCQLSQELIRWPSSKRQKVSSRCLVSFATRRRCPCSRACLLVALLLIRLLLRIRFARQFCFHNRPKRHERKHHCAFPRLQRHLASVEAHNCAQNQKIRTRFLAAPDKSATLESLVENEKGEKKQTATEGLMWLLRSVLTARD